MPEKKKFNWILVIAVLAAVVFFMNRTPSGGTSDGGDIMEVQDGKTTIKFEVRSASDLTQAVVDGTQYIGAEGRFGVSIGNNEDIDITLVTFAGKTDSVAATTPFDIISFYPSTISTLSAGTSGPVEWTPYFNLETYAFRYPGPTTFTFNYRYTYRDEAGIIRANTPLLGSMTVNIYPDACDDTTPFGECNDAGEECQYIEGTGLDTIPTEECCLTTGGIWDGIFCTAGCGGIPVGSCDTTPEPGTVKKNNYCLESQTLVEDCNQICTNSGEPANCFDWYGNVQDSCNADGTCEFHDYTTGVIVNIASGTQ